MPHYTPPLRDLQFVLHEVLNVTEQYRALGAYGDLDAQTIDAVLEEGGKFCSQVIAPLNASGDAQGCTLDAQTHSVHTPDGFKEAYAKYVEGGWSALACDPKWGGQGLPLVVNQAFYEMLNSANLAWTMYPGLAHGAHAAIEAHGTPEQKSTYLPRLTSGEWLGTMCLTEAHCGTDLGLLRTKAVPQADGSYLLSGSKIFISGGDSDLTANIVHLVLARLPDAPVGSKGISLFVVPKFLLNADGTLGARNPIYVTGIEHKMGINGSSTCQLSIEEARGWMVGQPNQGLAAMFVMMNNARIGVGLQGVGLTEVAYQNALAYAKERIQGRSLTGPKDLGKPADSILVHPDVRKMLLSAKAYAEGGRALALYCASLIDISHNAQDAAQRSEAEELVALLTPIVKAFSTDNCWIATSSCLQVLGGHGYIREWGLEQYVRDARICMLYEGTNTVQSLDLLGRKVLGNQGASMKKLGTLLQAFVQQVQADEAIAQDMQEFVQPLMQLSARITGLTTDIGVKGAHDFNEVGAAAVDYLRVVGHWVYGFLFARMAAIALGAIAQGRGDRFYQAKLQTARFYFARLFPETLSLMALAKSGAAALMDTQEALA